MIDGEQNAGTYELEGLKEGAVRLIIVDGIHLGDECIRIIFYVPSVVLVGASLKELAVGAFLISDDLLFRELSGNLAAQVKNRNACHLVEDVTFDVVVECPFGNAKFGMVRDDLIGRLSPAEKGGNDLSHLPCFLSGEVYALS